ncbi:MAG TPA: hypothetical protein VJK05_03315 [archaeon]|nr:hypothetical protein [archaeon]
MALEDLIIASEFWINVLVYLAIAVNLFKAKGNKKFHFIVVVIGFFAINYFIQNFFLASALLAAWFVFEGMESLVSKQLMVLMIAVMIVISPSSPYFYLIALMLYLITIFDFLYHALKKIS